MHFYSALAKYQRITRESTPGWFVDAECSSVTFLPYPGTKSRKLTFEDFSATDWQEWSPDHGASTII